MLDLIKPASWVGWTAVFIVIAAAVIAGMADGAHKLIRTAAWIVVLAVALVGVINAYKGK